MITAYQNNKIGTHALVDVRIDVYDRMFHVFQILPFLEESKQSYKIIGEFLDETFISD